MTFSNIGKILQIGSAYLGPFILFDLVFDDKTERVLNHEMPILSALGVLIVIWIIVTILFSRKYEIEGRVKQGVIR